jgi:PAS domain S-box-containing protein
MASPSSGACERGGEIVDFEWVYINPAGAATYGRSVELTIGARMRTVAPGIVASGLFDEYRHLVNTGEASSRMQMEYHDEAVHGVFDRLTWKLDDGFAVTWPDVSDRVQAVAALNSTERRFRSSIERLHEALSVFSAVRDERGFIYDFRWEFANSAASAITGYSGPELTGKTLMQVLPNHGPSGMLAVYRDVVETGEPTPTRRCGSGTCGGTVVSVAELSVCGQRKSTMGSWSSLAR